MPLEGVSSGDIIAFRSRMNGVWGCLACREHPGASKKKGADGGVDGEIFFRDHPDPKEKPQAKPMRQ